MDLNEIYFRNLHSCMVSEVMNFETIYLVNLSKAMKEVIDQVKSNPNEHVNMQLFDIYGKSYQRGVEQVYGRTDIGDKYYDMSTRHTLNVQRVAAHKAERVTSQLRGIVKDKEYEKKASQLLNQYNRYQAVEHNAVVARARTARQFARFQDKADIYPNLEWLRTRSADPRELHLSFVGTVRPQGDQFWQDNQPGNLYGCKCDWKLSNAPTTPGEVENMPPSPGLEGNPYHTGELITDKHPYMDVPENYRRKYLNLAYYDSTNVNVSVLANPKEISTAVNVSRRIAKLKRDVVVPNYIPNKSPGLIVQDVNTHLASPAGVNTVATAINSALIQDLSQVAIDLNAIDWTAEAAEKVAQAIAAQEQNYQSGKLSALYLTLGKSAVEVLEATTYGQALGLVKQLKPL